MTHHNSPYVSVFKRNGDSFNKLSTPGVLPSAAPNASDFSPDGIYLAVTHYYGTYVTIYKRSGDTFSKLDDPAVLPSNTSRGVRFSHDGYYLAVACYQSPYVVIYKRSGDLFTKLANPFKLPSGIGYSVSFSQNDEYLAVGVSSVEGLVIYEKEGDVFTKVADAFTSSYESGRNAGIVQCLSFSPIDYYLISSNTSHYLSIYRYATDKFKELSSTLGVLSENMRDLAFSPDGNLILIALPSAPYLVVFGKPSADQIRCLLDFGDGRYFPPGLLGIAQQSADKLDMCKVNLFPAVNSKGD